MAAPRIAVAQLPCPTTQSLVLGRDVYLKLGGFREQLGVDEDTFFLLEAGKEGVPLICDSELAYIHHGEPKTLREFFHRVKWEKYSASRMANDFQKEYHRLCYMA